MSCLRSCAPARGAPSSSARVREQQAAEQEQDEPQLIPEPAGSPTTGLSLMCSGSSPVTRDATAGPGKAAVSWSSQRWEQGQPIPRGREDRLLLAAERLEEQRDMKLAANRAYEDYRANGRATDGRRLGKRPNPWAAPVLPDDVVSVSDPDSQRMKASLGMCRATTPKPSLMRDRS